MYLLFSSTDTNIIIFLLDLETENKCPERGPLALDGDWKKKEYDTEVS